MSTDLQLPASRSNSTGVVNRLAILLANTHAVYLKTHGYHWNVRGENFHSLHTLFEGQYRSHWAAMDEIAERIRALGALAPQGGVAFRELTTVGDGNPALDASAMVEDLIRDNTIVLVKLRDAFNAADGAGDEATIDLINSRTAAHEKHAWMLRASLGVI
ncbi:Dps family protein [Novosphingobium terrae]|uniref:Dps family protein n=1 Tax=Novosphingobium terrae TaxID=2726189 RepID=UPI00197D8D8C|nr:Dps family protein [Novosphingobium terrae]